MRFSKPTIDLSTGLALFILKFDGVTTNNMHIPDNSNVHITGALTISAWVNFKSGNSATRIIFSRGASLSGNANESYNFGVNYAGNFIDFRLVNLSLSVLTSRISGAQPDVWKHVVATYDETSKSAVYLDGVLVDSDTGVGFGALNDVQINFGIGHDPSRNDYEFDGSLDEVRIYNIALSTDEVKDLYNLGKVEIKK